VALTDTRRFISGLLKWGETKEFKPAEICHALIIYLNRFNDFGRCVYLQGNVYFTHIFVLHVSCISRNKRPLISYTALTAWSKQLRRSDFQVL
jgi:hypothetical protein